MKKFKLPFNRIWLLLLGIILAGLVLSYGNAQYQKEINKPKQKPQLTQNEIVSDTKLEAVENSEQQKESPTHQLINSSTIDNSSDSADTIDSVDTSPSDTSDTTDITDINPPSQKQRKHQYVNFNIQSVGNYQIEYQDNDTGWDIMKRAAAKYHFPMKYQIFDFGIYISSIGGIEPEYGSYWALYHNDQYSMVGIQDLQVAPNDTVTWQVESWQ